MRIRSLSLLVFMCFSLSPLFARAEAWIPIAEPSAAHYYGISCKASNCVAVASSGSVAYSTGSSGAEDWNTASTGVTTPLRGVHVYSADEDVIAVGNAGKIITSTDGGVTWTVQTSGTTRNLYDVYMGSSTGWAVGDTNTIMRTVDEGVTWTNLAAMSINARQVEAASSTIWVTGKNGLVYATIDEGMTWTNKTSAVGASGTLGSMDFYDGSVGYIGGDNRFLTMTTDGGSTWTPVTLSGFDSTETVTGILATSSTKALVVGSNGHVASISSGTATAQDSLLDTGAALYGITSSSSYELVSGQGFVGIYDDEEPNLVSSATFSEGLYTNTTSPTLTWAASTDKIGEVVAYEVSIDGGSTWTNVGNVTSYTFSDLSSGTIYVSVRAIDEAGNEGAGLTSAVIVIDTNDPSLGSISPSSASEDVSLTFSLSATDATSDVDSCALSIDGSSIGSMTDEGDGTFSYDYTFLVDGTYTVSVTCDDMAGNDASTSRSVIVADTDGSSSSESEDPSEETADEVEEVSDTFVAGDLIKLACEGGEAADDPCKAVYYYGEDGKRHAFPNEKVYFTWYSDFDDVVTISDDAMADIMLGKNVTYHPGTTMVKFVTVNTVYVVDTDGSLRPVASEDAAKDLYGDAWNTHIDDISDVFYGNYTRSSDSVEGSEDFDPEEVERSADTIDDVL